ncbi:MAG: MoaD/ThiS family protein [Mycobacterium sp.]
MPVTIRYFAAARAAAEVEFETLSVPEGTTLTELLEVVADRSVTLNAVLARCSYLRNEVAVRDRDVVLRSGDVIDVLPPFAGG